MKWVPSTVVSIETPDGLSREYGQVQKHPAQLQMTLRRDAPWCASQIFLQLRHLAVFSLQSAVQQALMGAAAQVYSSFDACLALLRILSMSISKISNAWDCTRKSYIAANLMLSCMRKSWKKIRHVHYKYNNQHVYIKIWVRAPQMTAWTNQRLLHDVLVYIHKRNYKGAYLANEVTKTIAIPQGSA